MKQIEQEKHIHKHNWIKYAFGAQVCSICGINRSATGYKYKENGIKIRGSKKDVISIINRLISKYGKDATLQSVVWREFGLNYVEVN